MKKLYTLLVVVLIGFVGNAQIVTIPDANFKAKLIALGIDTNSDGNIQQSEALANTSLNVSSSNVSDLTGINSFTNLQTLDCSNNHQLSSINVSGLTNLIYLNCSDNQLSSINVSGLTNLQTLDCSSSQLPSINVSGLTNLRFLECHNNQLTSIDVSGLTNLQHIDCLNNYLSSIDVSGLNNLNYLDCSTNQLTSLNVSGLTNLQSLSCYTNQLTSINVSGLTNLQYLVCSNNLLPSLNVNGLNNLQTLYCSNNQLSSIDVSGLINLLNLFCSYNQLSSIDVSGLTNLQTLGCSNNQLSSIDVSGLTNLLSLYCSYNQLQSLNVSGLTNLQGLYCSYNQLLSINVSGLTNISVLYCGNNQLSSIDVSGLINLISLACSDNQLPSIDLSGLTNLHVLDCSYNQLPSIDLSGLTNLQSLFCAGNQLPSLNVSGLTHISTLNCQYNQLPSLDVSGLSYLQSLFCGNNQLTSLNVSGLSNLNILDCSSNQLNTLFIKNGSIESTLDFSSNPNLEYVCADDGQIASIQTQIAGYGYTNCHVNSYCNFTPGGTFYTIQGNNRYDSNSNGCDVLDINFPSLNLAITDGTNTGTIIPNDSGAYQYDIQAGTQTLTPSLENPTYFTVSPTTASVTFPEATSPFIQNFCITANGVHNDLEVVLLPISGARPGFDATYKIIYKNKGTGTQSGTVNLAFDDARLDYVSATPTVSSQATNSLSWSFSNLLPFETREILVTLNVNSPTETPAVNAGDILNYTATVTGATDETPADNTSTLNQTVVNALDPNDKTCVEGTTVSPSMIGQYVHYVIGFENDGTANAQNIVVKDIIDTAKFDVSTLVPLSGSASYTTRIINTNQVEFIFQNINLPFASGTNTGHVAFKIKTKPTLVVGDTFSNSANIYFDYNAPIVTNTATTTIATLGTQDFDFGSVFTLSPVPAKNSLTITTKQDVMMRSVSIYNTLGQLVQVNTNPNETIDVSGLQSGSYFIRITGDKGSASGKFVKE